MFAVSEQQVFIATNSAFIQVDFSCACRSPATVCGYVALKYIVLLLSLYYITFIRTYLRRSFTLYIAQVHFKYTSSDAGFSHRAPCLLYTLCVGCEHYCNFFWKKWNIFVSNNFIHKENHFRNNYLSNEIHNYRYLGKFKPRLFSCGRSVASECQSVVIIIIFIFFLSLLLLFHKHNGKSLNVYGTKQNKIKRFIEVTDFF